MLPAEAGDETAEEAQLTSPEHPSRGRAAREMQNRHHTGRALGAAILKVHPWTSSLSTTRKWVRIADSWAPPRSIKLRNQCLNRLSR